MYGHKKIILGIALFAITSFANGLLITSNLEDATNGGGFFGVVTFEDTGLNTVTVTADISDPINPGLTKGDILGLWFDLADFSALSGTASFINGSPMGIITSSSVSENAVSSSLGGNVNLNGTGATNWDVGLATGSNGGPDFYQVLSFDILWTGLDATQFDGQRVGMRVQSIEGNDGFSFGEGSSKLLGEGGGSTSVPEPSSLILLGVGMLGLGMARRKVAA